MWGVIPFDIVLLAAWLGACTGSLLGVVADRGGWRAAQSGRSSCVCGEKIGAVALLPVIGWLLLRGRAKCCGAPIPVRYPAAELSLGLMWGCCAVYASMKPGSVLLTVVCAVAASGAVLWVLRQTSSKLH